MNYLPILIRELETLKADARVKGEIFKIRSYDKVLKQLKDRTAPIHGMEDLGSVEGIGAGIKARFETIFANGYLPEAKEIQEAPPNPRELFLNVYGIGPKKAAALTESGLRNLDELRAEFAKNPKLLNEKQAIGLKYAEQLLQRIPRNEMHDHNRVIMDAIRACCTEAEAAIVGSYRREAPDSGDIDVLVTSKVLEAKGGIPSVVAELKRRAPGYLLETLAEGPHKFMGICRLGEKGLARRIDILLTSPEQYPFAVLYFTGSDKFNIQMRKHALQQGYSLNEHGLTPVGPKTATGPPPSPGTFKTERDIFTFLKYPYVDPKQRK